MIRDLIIATIIAISTTLAAYFAATDDGMSLDEFCAADPIACIILFEEIEPTEPTPAPREVMV